MLHDTIINNLCENFGKTPEDIAKRKFGRLPEYTYKEVLSRIIKGNNSSLSEVFPEMSRPTITTMLNKCFPGKSKDCSSLDWYVYLLNSINLRRCTTCNNILDKSNFYAAINKNSGLRDKCITCDNAANKIHRELNKEHYKAAKHQHYLSNKSLYIAKDAKRRAVKMSAVACWANMEEINLIYKYCPVGYHVDHIVPLQGVLVCGLHCEHNLQYLPATDNLSKGNKFNIDNYIHSLEYEAPY